MDIHHMMESHHILESHHMMDCHHMMNTHNIVLNIHGASLAQVQQTSLHPPVWTLTGRQATGGASTSLIHNMMESHHMMELHHMMTFHHMKTFYLGYDGLQSF